MILLSAEDDLADTIRPRLEAQGADCRKIAAIQAVARPVAGNEDGREFDLCRDLSRLREMLDGVTVETYFAHFTEGEPKKVVFESGFCRG